MAADSKCSDDDTFRFLTECAKLYRLKSGAILAICGDDDVRGLVSLIDNVEHGEELPTKEELSELRQETQALLYLPTEELWHIDIRMREYENSDEWDGSVRQILAPIAAIGSGSEFAIGAMEFGATAEEAVKCACKWDSFSAPPVITMELE